MILTFFSKHPLRTAALALAVVTFLFYAGTLNNAFVAHDDPLLITQNPIAQGISWQNIKGAFTTFDPELYVPLTILTYQIEWSLFGETPVVFHLTNLLLHVGSVVLALYAARLLARPLTSERSAFWIGVVCAGLFALHPLSVEAVAWASARKDVLSAFFFWAALLSYLRYREQVDEVISDRLQVTDGTRMDVSRLLRSNRAYLVSVIAFALGLLAKVSILLLPFVLLLTDYLHRRQPARGMLADKVPHLLLMLVFGAIAVLGKEMQLQMLSPFQLLLLWSKSIGFTLWKLAAPAGLTILYEQHTPVTISRAEFFLPFVLLLLLAGLALYAARRHRVVTFGIAFFLLMLLPSIATFWKNGFLFFASDRYSYVANVGFFFVLAVLIVPPVLRLSTSSRRSAVLLSGAGAVLVLVLGILTARQVETWSDTKTLYQRTIALNARPVLALNNLATTYTQQRQNDKALELYRKALSYNQRVPEVLSNIAKIHWRRGDHGKAAEWFRRSIHAIPDDRQLLEVDLTGYFFLARYHEQRGNTEKAFSLLEEAADIGKQFPLPHLNLGIMEQKYNRLPEALHALRNAVERDPYNTEARYRLAAVAAEMGRLQEAKRHLEFVVARQPGFEKAQYHLERVREIVR